MERRTEHGQLRRNIASTVLQLPAPRLATTTPVEVSRAGQLPIRIRRVYKSDSWQSKCIRHGFAVACCTRSCLQHGLVASDLSGRSHAADAGKGLWGTHESLPFAPRGTRLEDLRRRGRWWLQGLALLVTKTSVAIPTGGSTAEASRRRAALMLNIYPSGKSPCMVPSLASRAFARQLRLCEYSAVDSVYRRLNFVVIDGLFIFIQKTCFSGGLFARHGHLTKVAGVRH